MAGAAEISPTLLNISEYVRDTLEISIDTSFKTISETSGTVVDCFRTVRLHHPRLRNFLGMSATVPEVSVVALSVSATFLDSAEFVANTVATISDDSEVLQEDFLSMKKSHMYALPTHIRIDGFGFRVRVRVRGKTRSGISATFSWVLVMLSFQGATGICEVSPTLPGMSQIILGASGGYHQQFRKLTAVSTSIVDGLWGFRRYIQVCHIFEMSSTLRTHKQSRNGDCEESRLSLLTRSREATAIPVAHLTHIPHKKISWPNYSIKNDTYV